MSFKIGDPFDTDMLADLAVNLLINKQCIDVTKINFRKKASGFITGQMKTKVVKPEGRKWTTIINGKEAKRKVYQKAAELSKWKPTGIPKIPPEYIRFRDEWNNFQYDSTYTAEEFHEFLDSQGASITYIGQVSKFLWLIHDRGLCAARKIKPEGGPNSYQYKKKSQVSLIDLAALGKTQFFQKNMGPYHSKMDLINRLT